MGAVDAPRRHPLRLALLVLGAAALVAALAAAGVYVWLGSYAPLETLGKGSFAPGPGLGADVEPVAGSGGKTVFIPVYRKDRPFDTAFTLRNSGRFAVTVTGLARVASASRGPAPSGLLTTDSSTASADPGHLHAFQRLRLDPGDTAIVVVRWLLHCPRRAGETFADTLRLRYTYLSLFTRTQSVRLPFAVTLRCEGGPLANP
jgi:hypothetical protein